MKIHYSSLPQISKYTNLLLPFIAVWTHYNVLTVTSKSTERWLSFAFVENFFVRVEVVLPSKVWILNTRGAYIRNVSHVQSVNKISVKLPFILERHTNGDVRNINSLQCQNLFN